MQDKEYVVTLYNKEDLEQFYNEMQLSNFPLVRKRPISRNTHYMMNEEQAERLRQDPRVWGVELVERFDVRLRESVNREPYSISGQFWKDGPIGSSISPTDRQWGHLHCAGDQSQRRKNTWGDGSSPTVEFVNDTIDVFNNGKNVDVVIVDDHVAWDSEEWYSPTTGQTRFVQYQWFNELNSLVNSIDDDNQTEPTGTIIYDITSNIAEYHGMHVTGTTCGQYYGWAREANIYNIAITSSWPSGQNIGPLLIFDYLRAFHRTKPINPDTGYRNPTITNHSYGGIIYMPNEQNLQFSDILNIGYRQVQYSSSNPGPSGWSQSGVEADFGVRFNLNAYPSWSSSVAADVQDAIEEGIVIIGAAGNDNLVMDRPNGPDWDNYMSVSNVGTFYYNRGAWPCTADAGSINVGAMSDHAEFRRSTYTMYGPGIDVFAPGDMILSSYSSAGFNDTKYTQGTGNYFYPISGTSMASPQVSGVIACVAGGNPRFTQADAFGYLDYFSVYDDMTFDVGGGGLTDNTSQFGSPNKYLICKNPRQDVGYISRWTDLCSDRYSGNQVFPRQKVLHGPRLKPLPQTYTFTVTASNTSNYTFSGDATGDDPTINCKVGDTLVFNLSTGVINHPFWIKTARVTGTGSGVFTGTLSSNGQTTGTMTWDTTGINTGIYYYVCQYHINMSGQIIVTSA